MPIFRNKILAGSQFTGADSDTGLFVPMTQAVPGGQRRQVRVNSATFHTTGSTTTWTLADVDPTDSGNTPIALTDTSDDFKIQGILLATESDGRSWGLKLTTAGMTADGWFTVDHDLVETTQ